MSRIKFFWIDLRVSDLFTTDGKCASVVSQILEDCGAYEAQVIISFSKVPLLLKGILILRKEMKTWEIIQQNEHSSRMFGMWNRFHFNSNRDSKAHLQLTYIELYWAYWNDVGNVDYMQLMIIKLANSNAYWTIRLFNYYP